MHPIPPSMLMEMTPTGDAVMLRVNAPGSRRSALAMLLRRWASRLDGQWALTLDFVASRGALSAADQRNAIQHGVAAMSRRAAQRLHMPPAPPATQAWADTVPESRFD